MNLSNKFRRFFPVFVISWIFIFILGIFYEGIREIRRYLDEERRSQKSMLVFELLTFLHIHSFIIENSMMGMKMN